MKTQTLPLPRIKHKIGRMWEANLAKHMDLHPAGKNPKKGGFCWFFPETFR